MLLDRAGWERFRQRQREARQAGRYIGMGFAQRSERHRARTVRNGIGARQRHGARIRLHRCIGDGTGAGDGSGPDLRERTRASAGGYHGRCRRFLLWFPRAWVVSPAGRPSWREASVLQAAREVAEKAKNLAGMLMQLAAPELELEGGFVRATGRSGARDCAERIGTIAARWTGLWFSARLLSRT